MIKLTSAWHQVGSSKQQFFCLDMRHMHWAQHSTHATSLNGNTTIHSNLLGCKRSENFIEGPYFLTFLDLGKIEQAWACHCCVYCLGIGLFLASFKV